MIHYNSNPCVLWMVLLLESCGARFLAPRTGIALLSFAPTRTGPKNSKFYGPDPGPTRLYFPRTGPDRNSLASTRNLKVSTRTGPKILKYGKYFVLRSKRSNQVSDCNKHVNMSFNKVITSNNVLIKDNNHPTSSVWEWKASLSPKSQEKMSHTPVKKYPDPDRPEIKFPDPTRKYSLKCSPTPDRFRSGPVRSGETRGFGLPRRSLVVIMWHYLLNLDNKTFIWWNVERWFITTQIIGL